MVSSKVIALKRNGVNWVVRRYDRQYRPLPPATFGIEALEFSWLDEAHDAAREAFPEAIITTL